MTTCYSSPCRRYANGVLRLLLPMAAVASALSITARTDVVYTPADSTRIVQLLDEARHNHPQADSLMLFFARRLLGVPYVGHTLEVDAPQEPLVVNTQQLDCTTLVETVSALTLCAAHGHYTFAHYLQALTTLRYRGGQRQGYASRLHYFSQWIADNERRHNVSEQDLRSLPGSRSATLRLNYMSSHPSAYKALQRQPSLVGDIRSYEQQLSGTTVTYLPKSAVADSPRLRQVIRNGDILAITTNKSGLDIAHLGFAVWHGDGLHLLNASQLHHKVVVDPMSLRTYLSRHPSHTGIRVVRLTP